MKILVVVDTNFHTDERVKNECNILAQAGFELDVLHFNFGEKQVTASYHDNIKTLPVSKSKKWKNRWFFFSNLSKKYFRFWAGLMDEQLATRHYDAIHLHDLYMYKAALILKNKADTPIVLDLHENYPEAVRGYRWATKFPNRFFAMPGKWKSFAKQNLHKPDRLIVLSDSFKEQITQDFPKVNADHIYVYPNVPDTKKLLGFPQKNIPLTKNENDIFLLYFGGIAKRRGVFTAIESLNFLNDLSFDFKLLLIGPVDNNEKQQFATTIDQSKNKQQIIHLPWIDFEELPAYIRASDICLSPIVKNPQHESGVANKVFQYMLFAKPVVVSNCRPQAKIVEEEKCGLVFESENPEDLASKIALLAGDNHLRNRMGLNGQKAVLEKYNTEKMGRRLISLYQSFNIYNKSE
jgi:glycosyltransferase involved in cell wall biosynthesis